MMRVRNLLAIALLACANGAQADNSYSQALQLYNQQNYRAAADLFDRSARSQSNPATAYYYEALCRQQVGDFARAKQLYKYLCDNYSSSREGQYAAEALRRLDPNGARGSPAASDRGSG